MAHNDLVEEALTTPANDPLANMGNMEGDVLDDDFEPPAPSAYPLGTNDGRCGFLEAYIWRGEDALWESVNHIWHQLLSQGPALHDDWISGRYRRERSAEPFQRCG